MHAEFACIQRQHACHTLLLQGLPTIRAYDVADHFKGQFVAALDRNSSWWYAFLACSRWVGFRLDTLAAITLSFECILVMAVHQRVAAPPNLHLPMHC